MQVKRDIGKIVKIKAAIRSIHVRDFTDLVVRRGLEQLEKEEKWMREITFAFLYNLVTITIIVVILTYGDFDFIQIVLSLNLLLISFLVLREFNRDNKKEAK